jgi:hypothetical protein
MASNVELKMDLKRGRWFAMAQAETPGSPVNGAAKHYEHLVTRRQQRA